MSRTGWIVCTCAGYDPAMSSALPGMGHRSFRPDDNQKTELLTRQGELRRILSFAGWTIDDVIDNPIARRDVRQWYKLGRWMTRRLEIGELERQWNPTR